MFWIIILSAFTVFFEVFLSQTIPVFGNISLLFVIINLFFWAKKHRLAIVSGVIASILIDLLLQDHLGRLLFSAFFPILILSIFDNVLRIDSRLSNFAFSIVSTVLSILISDFLFGLLFWEGVFFSLGLLRNMLFSILVLILFTFIFGKNLRKEKREDKFL